MGRTALDHAIDVALVDICSGRVPVLPTGSAVAGAFAQAVRYHRIAPLAHVALRATRPDLVDLLHKDRDRAMRHHLRVGILLSRFGSVLKGIPWLVFKGPALSELAHPVPGLRSYKDLDLLVSPADLRTACERLQAAGWNVIDSNEALRSPQISGEIPMASPDHVLLDLHWSMVSLGSSRRLFTIPTERLLDHRVSLAVGPAKVSTLDPTDSLVHVCLHGALSGATKLIYILDADQLARKVDDWDLVAQRARELGAQAQVSVVLGRSRRLLATPVPRDLDRRLGLPPAFSWLMSFVDRTWPIPSLRRDASVPRLVARAASPGFVRTLGSVLCKLALHVVNQLRPPKAMPRWIPADSTAIANYFTSVESTAGHSAPPS